MSMKRLLGIAFIIGVVSALALSVLAYRKAFTTVTWVTLHADHTGLQLNDGADVKLLGVVIGDVRHISADGDKATIDLALQPERAARLPANVTARLLPKTLFGEKYVALQLPADPSADPLRDGAVIGQDRSAAAVELGRVLDRILPMLRAMKPDKLAATLGGLATALDGRGEQLGRDLEAMRDYLAALNEQMPAIAADIEQLADVLAIYDDALPELIELLRNSAVTATTLADQRDHLAAFLVDTADLADATRGFLDRYGDRIIQLGDVSAPVLSLLAAYSPEYPCLLRGLVRLQPQAEQVFAGGTMHITIEVTRDNGGYERGRDDPVYGARYGPHCHGLPGEVAVPAPEVRVNDGYDHGGARPPALLPVGPIGAAAAGGHAPAAMGYAGTAEERALLRPLLGAATGTSAQDVPDVAVLLWGPLLRGAVVNAS